MNYSIKHSFSFTSDQVQQILVDHLLAQGEKIPQAVFDSGGYADYSPDIDFVCVLEDAEPVSGFGIVLGYDSGELEKFKEAYAEKDATLYDPTLEPNKEEIPDNKIWNSGCGHWEDAARGFDLPNLPCGKSKSECPIIDELVKNKEDKKC